MIDTIVVTKEKFQINDEITKILRTKEIAIIALDYYSHKQLVTLGIKHSISDKYVDETDNKIINQTALSIATNWYKNKIIEEHLMIDKINFGWLLEQEFYYTILTYLTIFYSLLKIKEKEKPRTIIISHDLYEMATSIFTDCKIQTIGEQSNKIQQFHNERFTVKYNIGTIPLSIRIPRKSFFTIRKYYEKYFIPIFNKLFTKLDKKKKSILLVDFNPAQYGDFLMHLNKTNKNVLLLNRRRVAIWNFKSFSIVRKTHCVPVRYDPFLNFNDNQEILTRNLEINKKMDLLLQNTKLLMKIFSINNYSFWDYLKKYFKSYCMERFEEAIYEMIGARKMLSSLKPYVILHFYEVALQEKVLIFEARKQNISSILIQHGTPFLSFPDFHLLNPIIGTLPLYADKKMACWGNMVKDYAMKQGMNENNMIVSGSIKHDGMFRMKKKQIAKKRIILIALGQLTSFRLESQSITTYERYEKCLRIICNVLKKIPNCKKIAKLHPGDMVFKTVVVEPIIREIDPSTCIIVDADLGKLLQSADIVISIGLTTVLLEANIFEKPTATLVADRLEFLSVLSNGYTELFTDEEEDRFQKFLTGILTDDKLYNEQIKKGLNFVNSYMANLGGASEYLVQRIEQYS